MAGGWFVQVHHTDGRPLEAPIYLADFAVTLACVKEFKLRPSKDILRVHVPASATDQQRQELKENGATLV